MYVCTLSFLQANHDIVFDNKCIKDLKRGLQCIKLLKVPEEVTFHNSSMVDLFLTEERTKMPKRSFKQFRLVAEHYYCMYCVLRCDCGVNIFHV